MNTLLSSSENLPPHHELPSQKKRISEAVETIIHPVFYMVQDGDTVEKVAENLGIFAPPSLFSVQPGQTWQVVHGIMYNPKTGTSFPVSSANDERFSLAA